jgi:hypothetical protein
MKTRRFFTIALAIALLLSAASYRTSAQQLAAKKDRSQSAAPQASSNPVTGSGTVGRLSKWTGVDGANSFSLGNSNIFEDKFGKIGIGATAPTSPLTVQGMIETTLGGYKFPDGTVQTSALSAGQVVSSLNGLKGDVTLAAGANITITPAGNTLTIAATGALTGVAHDATLTGNGTSGSPLRVAVPLVLNGLGGANGVIQALSTSVEGLGVRAVGSARGGGVFARGGDSGSDLRAGVGVSAIGGDGNSGNGGEGLDARGGNSVTGFAGAGVLALGGTSNNATGAAGVDAHGGSASSNKGGQGVLASGGPSTTDDGGDGVVANGGLGNGAGNSGGAGIVAFSGNGGNGATPGLAGLFIGNAQVSGNLSKGGGSFKIDHPLDPENKYLYHSFVESPDMKNIYDGNITTDANGAATVDLPDWFEALNRDFCYQLTVIGTFAQAIVAQEIKGNRFMIKTNAPNVKVSWQVTGIRQDAFANKHRIPVEEAKPERERGHYLHPDAFDRPEERSINWARSPELMQRLQQRRLAAEQARRQ